MDRSRVAKRPLRGVTATLVAFALLFSIGLMPAYASAPGNDDYASATAIGALPFDTSVDISEATTQADEPTPGCFGQIYRTVWYTLTAPSSGVLRVTADYFYSSLAMYQVNGPNTTDLTQVTCGVFNNPVTMQAQVVAGQLYAIQVGDVFDEGPTITLHAEMVSPPANDNFASASAITSLPFSDHVDMAAATTEPNEPSPCSTDSLTVWYSFTAEASGSVMANWNLPSPVNIGIFQSSSLDNLSLLGCSRTFHVDSGQTYYIQVAIFPYGANTSLDIQFDVTPAPVPGFFFSPSDPSSFDDVAFLDSSFDPAGLAWTDSWTFGDGTTSTARQPVHRYGSDGDYTVTLTISTDDGRVASTSQVVSIRTHDVAITKFSVPGSAKVRQTKQITVGLNSKRMTEQVQVDLYKSVPGGLQLIGTSFVTVPVRSANRTTDVAFSYTFTTQDATVGKVTFKAVATIIGARDALPADNEAVSLPVKVSR